MQNTNRDQSMALVLQGGGQRGVFTAGVLDAFLDAGFDPFSCYIGVSAGALNLSSFLSRQRGYGRRFIADLTTDPQFFDPVAYVTERRGMDLDWMLNQALSTDNYRFDFEQAERTLSDGRLALACTTETEALEDHYFPLFDDWFNVARATCAIPGLYLDDIEHQGTTWVDGGVSAAIPVLEAWRRGYKNILVVRTQPLAKEPAHDEPTEPGYGEQLKNELELYLQQSERHKELGALRRLEARVQVWQTELDQICLESSMIGLLKNIQGRLSKPSPMLNILLRHQANIHDSEEFMASPPDGVNLVQLAPDSPLASMALLSSKDDLEADYQAGLTQGRRYLESQSIQALAG